MTRGLVNAARDTVRTQLWPLPVLGVVVAVVVGLGLPQLDEHVDGFVPSWLSAVLFSGDPDAARTVLDAVSGSLITVTSLTFSLTVVTLQLASSQFSPRLLRTFTSDLFVQATLGLFLATFTFALTVLRSVRGGDSNDPLTFVPRISVTFAFVLGIASVIGLVVFLAHLARQIRVETMLREVHADASDTVAGVLLPRADPDPGPPLTPPEDAQLLFATTSGFLVRVDEGELLACAVGHGVQLALDPHPGDSIVVGTPVGRVWSHAGALRHEDVDQVRDGVAAAMRVGAERTAAQDVGFGLRQLTDVANKALSPGINDPTTAVHALGHVSALLCELAGRDLGPRLLRDDDRQVRVMLRRPDLAELVDAAITQPRRYGASDPQVLDRLFSVLAELAWHVAPGDEDVVTTQLERLDTTVEGSDFDATERDQLAHASARVTDALARARAHAREQPNGRSPA